MAWRIDRQILRGELDNTIRGRATGRLWLHGFTDPITLDLHGDCMPDLAGCTLTFTNPQPPVAGDVAGFTTTQRGWVGDITAAQKLKVHDVPIEEVLRLYQLRQPAPWHWANALYLEWFSESNGRVVIQTAGFDLQISTPNWTLTDAEYRASREASGAEHLRWMETHFGPLTGDVQIVDLNELTEDSREEDDDEGEEWKRRIE